MEKRGSTYKMSGQIVVPSDGPLTAEICIVGEAPGQMELAFNRPFVGTAGKLLDSLLAQAGIIRSQCYLTNIMKVRPPKNDFGTFWLDKKQREPTEQLKEGTHQLYIELRQLKNLKVIIALGRQPLYILTGRDGITKWRGSILDSPFVPLPQNIGTTPYILPTFHPSFCLRQYDVMPIFLHDLKKAKSLLTVPLKPKKTLVAYPTDNEICRFFDEWTTAPERLPLSTDIECCNKMISRISFSIVPSYAMSIPFFDLDTFTVLPGRAWIWEMLSDYLPYAPIVGQNFLFDLFWLWEKQGIDIKNLIHDTMIAQHNILPGLPSFLKPLSLGFLTSIYTDEPYYKDEGKILKGRKPSDHQYGIYSARDAAITLEVYQEQITNKVFLNQKEIFEYEMDLIRRPIKEMSRRGVLIDISLQERLRKRAAKELEFLELSIAVALERRINLRSPKQIKDLLYKEIGLKGGVKQSTDEEALKLLQVKHSKLEILDYILQHRGIEQVFKNILSAKADDDGRMRCSYLPTTDTGRFKSFKNPFGSGTNTQNIPLEPELAPENPDRIRGMFVPDPGYYLIEADLEQAELRCVAYMANERKLIQLLESEGCDIHTEMAQAILQKAEITKEERQLGKRTVHAGDYLISARGLSRACRIELGIDIPEKRAQELLNIYFIRFPGIPVWHKEIEGQLSRNNRILINPFGRRRQFFQRWGPELFRKATADQPQGTIAMLLNKIMLRWMDEKTVGDLLMQLHDAFYIQAPIKDIKIALKELTHAFNYQFTINGHNVVIPVKLKVSRTWGGEAIKKGQTK